MPLIARFFLRAKHWQLFLLLFGIGFVGDVGILGSAVASPSQQNLGRFTAITEIVTLPFLCCFLAWFWSVGSFCDSLIRPERRLSIGFFRFALIYPALYIFMFIALLPIIPLWSTVLILPLHLFAMFCLFYELYFASKSLVLAETGRAKSFYDYAGPFFLLWFFPIGVWFIQPRINRLYLRHSGVSAP